MKRFLSQLFAANKSAPRRPAAPPARLGIECLEGRELPSTFGLISQIVKGVMHTVTQVEQQIGHLPATTLSHLLQAAQQQAISHHP